MPPPKRGSSSIFETKKSEGVFKYVVDLKGKGLGSLEVSDKDLMLLLCKGEITAFRKIYDRFVKRVFSMAYRFCRDYETSKDITQEVFLRLYQKRDLYKPDISFNTFFYRLTYNCILNYIRDHKIRSWKDDPAQMVLCSPITPDQATEANELLSNIERKLNQLPENQKMAFILHKIEGLKYEEIAEVMDININTVKSLIHRATLCILETKNG
ncbi:MAG: RNA polymerase sigma factor [Deltaproteobacteria bacterium]|nr:RNA polymerase sigma factor [Deltaproteobacteria bacterium]